MTSLVAPGTPCVICGVAEPNPLLLSICFDCNDPFHLNPRANSEGGIDCGDAVLGELAGVYYYCNRCLAVREELDAPPGVDIEWARAQAYASGHSGGRADAPPLAPAPPPPARPAPGDAGRTRRRYRRIDRDQP